MTPKRSLLTACAIALLVAAPASAFDVFFCGQGIPPGETGTLVNDLACIGTAGVLIDPRGTLEMNGHDISGGTSGVFCTSGRCTVHGPGRIIGSSSCGVQSGNNVGRVRIDLRDIEINDANCALAGAIAKDISLRMKDVSATGNGSGFSAGKINATGLTVTNTTNTGGVDGRRSVRLIDSTIEANNGIGVIARKGATLRNSSVTGNADYDVASHLPPHVYSSTCGTSVVLPEPFMLPGPGEPSWGVCSGD